MVTILNSEEIAQVLTPRLCLDALEEAFAALGRRQAATAVDRQIVATKLARTFSEVTHGSAYHALEVQCGSLPRAGVASLRIKSDVVYWTPSGAGFQRNKIPAATGQQYCGLVILFSLERCEPIAIMPDGLIQRERVGATAALGAKYLANPDAEVLGLIGAGFQAASQVTCISAVRPIKAVRVFSPTRSRRERFASEMGEKTGLDVRAVTSAAEAAGEADILASATNSRGAPTLTPDLLHPGLHLSAIGVDEVAPDLLIRVDVMATTRRPRMDAGSYAIAGGSAVDLHEREFEHGWWQEPAIWDRFFEIADLIAGRVVRRSSPDAITLFQAGGAAVQFAAVGARVLAEAKARGLGRELDVNLFVQPFKP